tara:strand:+ start:763 stop:2022 length:1260 start_codon:yes stop_codon:yes gene_type:complete
MVILIPIFSDAFLHPLHKDNNLSLLYIRHIGDSEGKMICVNHPDCIESESIDNIKNDFTNFYIVPDAKSLKHIFPNTRLIDVKYLNWKEKNIPLQFEDITLNAYDFLHSKYYNVNKLNEIIPFTKHKEYCDKVFDKMKDSIDMVCETKYHSDVINAFSLIEKEGIKVTENVCEIFDERVRRHISESKLYSQYNLWTATGRPSNSFGNINFAALTPEHKKAFIPENNFFVEFDFDAYHLRLIADLVDYKFQKESVHNYLAKYYECDYKESKAKSFKLLYGGVDKETREKVPFFDKVYKYINSKWLEFNGNKYVKTDIYSRKLQFNNYASMNKTKLFNYLIQAYETESNIQKINKLHIYLKDKKSNLVLYCYDSFLFDFHKEDGVETLKDIKNILEQDKHYTKSKMGLNYSEMIEITERLQ